MRGFFVDSAIVGSHVRKEFPLPYKYGIMVFLIKRVSPSISCAVPGTVQALLLVVLVQVQ
jgi:hypothetical protein